MEAIHLMQLGLNSKRRREIGGRKRIDREKAKERYMKRKSVEGAKRCTVVCYFVKIYRTLESWGKCFELASETFLVVNAPTGSTYLILHGIKPVECKHILSVKCSVWNKHLQDEIFWGKKISFSNWIHYSSTRSKRIFFRFLNFSFTMYCVWLFNMQIVECNINLKYIVSFHIFLFFPVFMIIIIISIW